MKTIGTFTQLGHDFIVKVNIMKTNSNHNAFAHVFHEGEKQPLCGTSFADVTGKDDIILWAKKRVGEIQSGEFTKDIFSHRKPQTAEEKYPELNDIANSRTKQTISLINELARLLCRGVYDTTTKR